MTKKKLLYTGSEWDVPLIEKIWATIDNMATKQFGLDYYKPQIEIITSEMMLDCYSSVAMPVMYPHWSFGKTFIQNERQYNKGMQGLAYEVVINTNPCIAYLMENNCVDGETEYLSPTGWKKITKYSGEKILGYNEDGTAEFTSPKEYVVSKVTEPMIKIKAKGIDQLVTQKHRVIYIKRNGQLGEKLAKDVLQQHNQLLKGWDGRIITAYKIKSNSRIKLTDDEIRLMCAVHADGCFPGEGTYCRFGFKKKEKIDRLISILNACNLEYRISTTNKNGSTHISCHPPLKTKSFDSSWYSASSEQLNIIAEEVFYWDADLTKNNTYYSYSKEDVDFIQFACNASGKSATIRKTPSCYSVYKSDCYLRNVSEISEQQEDKAYCFKMPSTMWVARRNGKVFVTGNTATLQTLVLAHASVGHSYFFKNNYLFKGWTDADTIVDYLKFAKKYIKSCEEKYGEKRVEQLLDSCHALQNHSVDKYKKPSSLKKELKKQQEKKWEDYFENTFNDIWRTVPNTRKEGELRKGTIQERTQFPEENILYFLEKNSPILESWEREILRIVRKISQYFYPQRQTQLLNEGWACYKGDTEFLSQKGWKKIKDYSEGDLVAQYHKNGDISFVSPLEYVYYKNAPLLEIKAEGINQCVTPNHRMIFKSSRGHLNVKRADEIAETTSRRFITSGKLVSNSKLELTDANLRLMVAIIADGTFNSSSTYCQMGFIKSRKIERIEKLLKEADISYTKSKWSQGRTGFSFYAPLNSKSFKNWYSASVEQLNLICEEALEWDAYKDRNKYFSTDKDNMDFIQFALAMTHRRGTLTFREAKGNRNKLWIVTKVNCNEPTLSGGSIQEVAPDTVYCFKVPTGMLVTRRENVINISGNTFCHHMIMTELHDQGYIDEGSYIEFLHSHSGVIAQRSWKSQYYSGINVYALGFAMLMDIKRMCISPDEEDKKWFPEICGQPWLATITDIVQNYRDESFVLQFLSPKVARHFKLFSFNIKENKGYLKVNATHDDESFLHIRKTLAEQYDLSRAIPQVEIVGVDWKGDRWLYLEHRTKNNQRLDYDNMKKTVEHIHKLWGFTVKMEYKDLDGNSLEDI